MLQLLFSGKTINLFKVRKFKTFVSVKFQVLHFMGFGKGYSIISLLSFSL